MPHGNNLLTSMEQANLELATTPTMPNTYWNQKEKTSVQLSRRKARSMPHDRAGNMCASQVMS